MMWRGKGAPVAWLPVDQGLVNHRKVWALERLLELPVPTVVGHLLLVWLWAIDSAEDGCIADGEAWAIEKAAGWPGDPGAFVAALEEAGFLDRLDGCVQIHNWDEYGGRVLAARERNAQKQRRYRERNRNVPATLPGSNAPERKIDRKIERNKPAKDGAGPAADLERPAGPGLQEQQDYGDRGAIPEAIEPYLNNILRLAQPKELPEEPPEGGDA